MMFTLFAKSLRVSVRLAATTAALGCMALMGLAGGARAADSRLTVYESDSNFEDTIFALESAVIGNGLTIDYHSHIGEMLSRTGADVGSDVQVFEDAQIFVFCSAVLSRKMMEADASNVGFCPWSVYAYATPAAEGGEPRLAFTGFRRMVGPDTPADSPMHEIDALLDSIVREAAGLE